jgi:hypothetical protein
MNFNSGKKVFRLKRWKKIRLQDLADKETQEAILAMVARDNEAQEPHKYPQVEQEQWNQTPT